MNVDFPSFLFGFGLAWVLALAVMAFGAALWITRVRARGHR